MFPFQQLLTPHRNESSPLLTEYQELLLTAIVTATPIRRLFYQSS
ncbi:hypothetical protein COO91_04145 [Nostoc flagelliforme CCNUN1]|uniref:Uncharacterized protein n=1 Tax=Nostoc flagelliforme CCNUN1 TaxID=2038116 RepID=A0A2K8SS63_9NOSO|nr:hypothetical protein COO91_04145 [Nostoc flagelliforme CCNUN1]